ncbi:hypothetical protein J6590_005524 [Homalodisca vitripennis]|nr:hypothetical protein J6590_005524 [Homalodisca vitripennis]
MINGMEWSLSGRVTESESLKAPTCNIPASPAQHCALWVEYGSGIRKERTQMFEARVCRRITANKSSIVRLWPKNVLPVVVYVIMSAKLSWRTRIIVND